LIRRNSYIFVLAVLFFLFAHALDAIGFWGFAGLPEPHGYRWQGGLFLIFLFIGQNWIFGPYLRVLEEREAQTTRKKAAAEKVEAGAREDQRRYLAAMHEADHRAARTREEQVEQAEAEARAAVSQAREASHRRQEEFLREIEAEGDGARRDLQAAVPSLSQWIVEQTLSRRAADEGSRENR